jgi:hypothetical protein
MNKKLIKGTVVGLDSYADTTCDKYKKQSFFNNPQMHISGTVNKHITHELYTGECEHPEDELDSGYGFTGASYGFPGVGIYAECNNCRAVCYQLDEATEKEKEWYKNSPVSKGWVVVTRNK